MTTVTCSSDNPDWKDADQVTSLKPDEIHVWLIKNNFDTKTINDYKKLLSPAELSRADQYFKFEDTFRYINRHGALRIILSRYMNLDARLITFSKGKYDKPKLGPDHKLQPPLCFNISYSGYYSLIGISNSEVGVDIEFLDARFDYSDIIEDYLSVEEATLVQTSKDPLQEFYKYWTRKEAFYKGLSLGINDNFKNSTFLDHINYIKSGSFNSAWAIRTFNIDNQYLASIAYPGNTNMISYYNFNICL